MPEQQASQEMTRSLVEEDALRAQMYAFLARLLAAPPDKALLETISKMGGSLKRVRYG